MSVITEGDSTSAARSALVQGLHARYSARLAALTAERLARTGGDLQDVDDLTQSVWETVLQLLVVPTPDDDHAWLTLAALANRVIAGRREQQQEVPVGIRLAGAQVLPLDLAEDLVPALVAA